MIEYPDAPETWPQRGRGGWLRNYAGNAIVSHPDGGKRVVEHKGASSFWVFDPYTSPPGKPENYYADRGTHLHDLCDLADRGQQPTPEFIAHGEALDIPVDVQRHAYRTWLKFREDHGLHAVAIEQPWVRDDVKVASNADRIDRHPDGTVAFGDIKSSANVCKVAYLVQLALGAHESTLPYDFATESRGEWAQRPRSDVAYIYWYPLNAKCRGEDVGWQKIVVPLADGHRLVDEVARMAATTIGKDFTIVAPAPLPAVEHDATGDDARQGASPVVSRTVTDADAAELEADGVDVDAYVALPPPATDRRTYRDRAANATVGQVEDVAYLNDHPDEGATVDAATVNAIGALYFALEPAAKSWVSACGNGIRLSGTTGKPTQRRLMALTGLLTLAEGTWDNDDALRAVIEHILGDVAMFANVKPAALVGALGVDEATRFATLCEAVAAGQGSYRHDDRPPHRLHIDGLAAVA